MYEARQNKEKVSRQINAVRDITKQEARNHSKNREGIKLNHGCTSSILQFFMSVDEFKKDTPISKTQHRRKLANIDSAIIDLDEDVKNNINLDNFTNRLNLLENLRNQFESYSGKRDLKKYIEMLMEEIEASNDIKNFTDTSYQPILNPKSLEDSLNNVGQIKEYLEKLKKYEQVINGRNVSSLKTTLYNELNSLSRNVYDMYIKKGNAEYNNAVKFLNETYFDDNITINVDASMKSTTHASTGGKIDENMIDTRYIKFNPAYLLSMNDGTIGSFYKVINTLKHERKHFEQRSDPDYSTKTTKEEREFMAYSEELIETEGIPQLIGQYYISTYNKMKKNYDKIMKNTQISNINKNTYKQRFDSIHI